jgi:hypothetical protein
MVLVACVVPNTAAKGFRSELKSLLLPGQRSIHFAKESDRRRRQILAKVKEFEVSTYVFDTHLKPDATSRELALRQLLTDLAPKQICLELDVSSLNRDQAVLADFEKQSKARNLEFGFGFEIPSREPLLWLPDIFAWCYQRGPKFKLPRSVTRVNVDQT